jgi:hypothetical protein
MKLCLLFLALEVKPTRSRWIALGDTPTAS